ncbi:MAG: hypothetical protein M0030_00110 [Actinomycetota bacterium]|nr:hypothetical protein [Actinomycetota bacterium]
MPNYWIGIMAAAFVIALATWLGLVFYADSHPHGKAGESSPHREIMGGSFEAREGGRQVMPIPGVPPAREPGHDELAESGSQAESAGASGQAGSAQPESARASGQKEPAGAGGRG